ncbi:MAG: FHA domain-containing protein, partial [Gemmatimonadales bacterium]|nr:FHA domain-containing protein [Gemmatimonadales bacterium]
MMELEYNGRHHPIPSGEMAIGSDPDSALRLSGEGVLWQHAIVQGMPDGSVAIRRASPDAEITVNGVLLGENPSPLLHGDKVCLGELELRVVDSVRAGHTEFMSSAGLPDPGEGRTPTPEWTAAGGRLVCLTDGREYDIEDTAVLGREASADVVVAGQDVSRKHAEITHRGEQYILTDHSTNGTFVNGLRIGADRVLARSDVIRIGTEEFRFYADMTPTAAPDAGEVDMADEIPYEAPLGASEKLTDTLHGIPLSSIQEAMAGDSAESDTKPAVDFGSLLVRHGPHKGERLAIRSPVVNLGRADHNDLVLDDTSVSTSHAKLQLREGIWFLSDLGSTNGTLVEGEEVVGEMALAPGATIRLGEMALLFDPSDVELPELEPGGTRVVAAADEFEPEIEPEPEVEPHVIEGWEATAQAPEAVEVSHT